MERFDVSPIKINHLAFKLSKSGAPDLSSNKGNYKPVSMQTDLYVMQ